MATRWVYLARYIRTCSGPPNGGLAQTIQSLSRSGWINLLNEIELAIFIIEPLRKCDLEGPDPER
jgi:hypothetical protein